MCVNVCMCVCICLGTCVCTCCYIDVATNADGQLPSKGGEDRSLYAL